MTWLLASGLVGAVGVIAVLVGAGIWLVKRSLERADSRTTDRVALEREKNLNLNWQQENEAVRKELADSEHRLSREVVARKTAERQRNALLTELADQGSPSVVADDIRNELRGQVPDVPDS